MTDKKKLQVRILELKAELREISAADGELNKERFDELRKQLDESETRLQGFLLTDKDPETRDEPPPVDAELRERINLRNRCRLSNFLQGAKLGSLSGAEAELADGYPDRSIPLELFDTELPETRATTGAPSTGTGVNLQPIVPAVFAESVAGMLGISMRRVPSGTVSYARISTNLTAGAQAEGGQQAATAAAFTVVQGTPHRYSAALSITAEALATVGTETFESALRSNMSMVLSDTLNKALLRGDGSSNTIKGIINEVGAPTAESTSSTWETINAKLTGLPDGIWAKTYSDVSLLTGVDTLNKFAALFPAVANVTYPQESAYSYWMGMLGGLSSNANMPAAASDAQSAIVCRKGRAMETAVQAVWDSISITDIYSDSDKATTNYVMHLLLSDVLIIQPGAYSTLSFKIA